MKIEVCLPIELQIENEFTEEWSVLPTNWKIPLDTSRTMFDKNFFLLEFHPMDSTEDDDLLILNLDSRKPFWFKKRPLEIEIKARVTALDPEWDFNENFNEHFTIEDSYFREMNVKQNKIEIIHHMNLDEWSPYSETIIGLC